MMLVTTCWFTPTPGATAGSLRALYQQTEPLTTETVDGGIRSRTCPLSKGSNREAGAGHHLVCRKNFETRVKKITPTKWQAAKVFDELQAHYDEKESGNWMNRGFDWFKRFFKTGVVTVCPGYFHKHNVEATYEELTGSDSLSLVIR